jgi:hypothetical protein
MFKTLLAVIVLLTTATVADAKTSCRTSHSDDGYYAYRLIDGKKCWYKGERGRDKERLFWSAARAKPRPIKLASLTVPMPAAEIIEEEVAISSAPEASHQQLVPLVLAPMIMGHTEIPPWLEPVRFVSLEPSGVSFHPRQQFVQEAPKPIKRAAFPIFTFLGSTGATVLAGLGFMLFRDYERTGQLPIPDSWKPVQLRMRPC